MSKQPSFGCVTCTLNKTSVFIGYEGKLELLFCQASVIRRRRGPAAGTTNDLVNRRNALTGRMTVLAISGPANTLCWLVGELAFISAVKHPKDIANVVDTMQFHFGNRNGVTDATGVAEVGIR